MHQLYENSVLVRTSRLLTRTPTGRHQVACIIERSSYSSCSLSRSFSSRPNDGILQRVVTMDVVLVPLVDPFHNTVLGHLVGLRQIALGTRIYEVPDVIDIGVHELAQ
jgi:hypothetical protein